jgi:hypothetical protein
MYVPVNIMAWLSESPIIMVGIAARSKRMMRLPLAPLSHAETDMLRSYPP